MIDEETRKKLDDLKFPITTKDIVVLTGKTNQQIGHAIAFLSLPCKKKHGSLQITRSETETLIEHFAVKANKASKDMMNKIQQIQKNALKKEEETMTVQISCMTLADIAKRNGISNERAGEIFEALHIKPYAQPDEDSPYPLYKAKTCESVERYLIQEAERKEAEEAKKKAEAEAAEKAKAEKEAKAKAIADIPPEVLAATSGGLESSTKMLAQLFYLQLQEQKKTNELLQKLLTVWEEK